MWNPISGSFLVRSRNLKTAKLAGLKRPKWGRGGECSYNQQLVDITKACSLRPNKQKSIQWSPLSFGVKESKVCTQSFSSGEAEPVTSQSLIPHVKPTRQAFLSWSFTWGLNDITGKRVSMESGTEQSLHINFLPFCFLSALLPTITTWIKSESLENLSSGRTNSINRGYILQKSYTASNRVSQPSPSSPILNKMFLNQSLAKNSLGELQCF